MKPVQLKSLRYRVRRYPTFIVGGRTRVIGWQTADLEAALRAATGLDAEEA